MLGELVSASSARPEQGREASHRVAVIIRGSQKAVQLASDHASMAQTNLCSSVHRCVGPHGSPCHRSMPTCLVPAKLKSASKVHHGNASWRWRHATGCRQRLLAVRRRAFREGVARSDRPKNPKHNDLKRLLFRISRYPATEGIFHYRRYLSTHFRRPSGSTIEVHTELMYNQHH